MEGTGFGMAFTEEHFIGGALCLDFANTVGGHRDGEPKETLHAYSDLLEWGVSGGNLSKAAAARLREAADSNPPRATRTLTGAKELREAIYEIFVALADKRSAPAADLAKLNAAV